MGEWLINDFIPDPNTGKDRWQIYKILKGGMGVVYIVYDAEWREAFAVKTYQDKLQSERAREQFKKEANIWINLDRHENVAWAQMVQNIQDRLYLFMEYVPGGDLSRWICRKHLDLKKTLLFAIQFCYGMEHALSKGVKAHRDIKPQNCLVTEEGILKISDFGLAKSLVVENDSHGVIGTPEYMPPEQWDNFALADEKSDIYSFGAMLYEMVIGKPPFGQRLTTPIKELKKRHKQYPPPAIPSLQNQLNSILQKCLAKNPWERYVDFGKLRRELAHLYENTFKEEAPWPRKEQELSAVDLANKGTALGNLEQYEEAITYFNEALKINPKFVLAFSNKGVALGFLGRFKEEIKCYDKALEIDSNFAFAYSNKGTALANLGRNEEALICYDRAIEIDRNYAQAWYSKGVTIRDLKSYEEAIYCYDRALDINPNDARIWYNKGIALIQLRQYGEAVFCFDHVIKIDPKNAEAWYNKGVALGNLSRYSEEINCYNKAIEIEPKYANAWSNKGTTLANMGYYSEAITCYNHALNSDPELAIAWYSKGSALGTSGHFEEALPCFDRAIKIDPQNVEAWYNKGSTLINIGKYREAISCCDQAIQIDPKHAGAWYNKGASLGNLGRFQESLNCFERSYKLGHPQAKQAIILCQQLLREKGY